MVKITGPLASQSASGSLGEAMTFSHSHGRAYLKKKASPKQPRTGKQITVRALMKFLSQEWNTFSAAQMTTWAKPAFDQRISNYHAYIQINQERWNNAKTPTKEYPAAESSYTRYPQYNVAWDKVASILYRTRISGVPYPWGYLLCRSTVSGFTPGRGNTVHFFPQIGTGYTYFLDTPLDPGTYYYRCAAFNDDGTMTVYHAECSGVAG